MPVSRSIPGLVHILQVGRDDAAGYFYYVMELAEDGGRRSEDGRQKPEDGEGGERRQNRALRLPPSGFRLLPSALRPPSSRSTPRAR